MPYGIVTLVGLVLTVYCVLDILRTPDNQVRNLPKLLWVLFVVLFPLIGGAAWLLAGRPAGARPAVPGSRGLPRRAKPAALSPDDDEDFLRSLRQRAAEQRREAEERRRREGDTPPA